MRRSRALAGLVLSLVSACSLFNEPESIGPEPNECDGGRCDDSDPCERCDASEPAVRPREFLDDPGKPGCDIDPSALSCACADGYERGDGGCEDIDECARGTHDCDGDGAICLNEIGGFSCTCPRGFRLRDDARSCADVDECSESKPCAPHAQCLNSPGSFECTCDPGYTGDGRSDCTDTDECANRLLECNGRAVCRDLPGLDRCVCGAYYSDPNGDGSFCADDRVEWALFAPLRGALLGVTLADASGGVPTDERMVMAGGFEGELTDLCDTAFSSGGGLDVYVAVFSVADNHCLWARSFGSPEHDWVFDVAMDPLGGVVLLWRPNATTELDGTPIAVDDNHRLALIRLDDRGALDWSLLVPGAYNVYYPAEHFALDAAGDIYLSVALEQATSLGSLVFAEPTGLQGTALAKISLSGAVLWAYALSPDPTSVEADPYVSISALAVDPAGYSYFNGNARGIVQFDTTVMYAGLLEYLVALDPQGAPRWVRAAENDVGPGQFEDLAVDGSGVVRALTHDADGLARGLKQFSAADGVELAKRQFGVGESLFARDLELDANGGMLLTGSLAGSVTLAGEDFARVERSAFLARLDAAGERVWAQAYEATGYADDLAVTPSGAIYLSGGYFEPPVEFGDGIVADHGEQFVIRLRP